MDATVRPTMLSSGGETLAELLSRIARNNEGALAELYDRTCPHVYGLALRMVREPSAAEDITQEVYMQVWRRADAFDAARGTVLSWIVTIARSRALDPVAPRGPSLGAKATARIWIVSVTQAQTPSTLVQFLSVFSLSVNFFHNSRQIKDVCLSWLILTVSLTAKSPAKRACRSVRSSRGSGTR